MPNPIDIARDAGEDFGGAVRDAGEDFGGSVRSRLAEPVTGAVSGLLPVAKRVGQAYILFVVSMAFVVAGIVILVMSNSTARKGVKRAAGVAASVVPAGRAVKLAGAAVASKG